MTPFKRLIVVSYRLSVVTVALSVTIRPQFAITNLRSNVSDAEMNRGVSLWAKISGVDPWCLGLQKANIPG